MISIRGQINFNFIFAIIVGAAILFIAVFASVRYSSTSSYQYNTELTEKLNILLDPLETSSATSIATVVNFKEDARLAIDCNEIEFGRNTIKIDIKSGVGGWTSFGVPASSSNKYIFAPKLSEGRQLGIFSRSFEMPFYVSDLIYAGMKQYCFISPPDNIKEEIVDINLSNVKIVSSKTICKKNDTTVCFGAPNCNINVYGLCSGYECSNEYDFGTIEKTGTKLNYAGESLLYAAIFSDSNNYKCNFNRLMYRTSKLTDLYYQKAMVLETKGCSTGDIKNKLKELKTVAVTNASPQQVKDVASQLQNENDMLSCRLW